MSTLETPIECRTETFKDKLRQFRLAVLAIKGAGLEEGTFGNKYGQDLLTVKKEQEVVKIYLSEIDRNEELTFDTHMTIDRDQDEMPYIVDRSQTVYFDSGAVEPVVTQGEDVPLAEIARTIGKARRLQGKTFPALIKHTVLLLKN